MTDWLFALGTAAWFGVMALRAGRNCFAWALGGALFGLVAATLVLGVFHATFLPMSHAAYEKFHVKSIASAALVILVLGWLSTASLHRHPQRLWQAFMNLFSRPA
jgi:hypothetical protein